MAKKVAILGKLVDFDAWSREQWHIACHRAGAGECHCYCRPPFGCGEDCPAYDEAEAERVSDLLAKFGLLDDEGEVCIPWEDPYIYILPEGGKEEKELAELADLFEFYVFPVEKCPSCGMWYEAGGDHECEEVGWRDPVVADFQE